MGQKLQFLIPHYKEKQEVISNLIDSIKLQQQVNMADLGCIIVDDGPDSIHLEDSFLKSYPFEIIYKQAPKGGVSATRNACLDEATSDYVMFCDADDMFMNSCGLYILFREIENNEFDLLISTFVEETRDFNTMKPIFVNHDIDFTFVHGKVLRREFLKNKKIRWNPNLTIHEDSYFNMLAMRCAKEVKHCQTPFYLWKWRDESVCRHDPKYMLKTYNNMIESNTALVNELKKRGMVDAACELATQMTFDSYYTMNKKEWLDQENQEYRKSTERRFSEYYREFKVLVDLIGEDKRNQIIVGIKNRMFGEGVMLEKITFDDWIKHISEI